MTSRATPGGALKFVLQDGILLCGYDALRKAGWAVSLSEKSIQSPEIVMALNTICDRISAPLESLEFKVLGSTEDLARFGSVQQRTLKNLRTYPIDNIVGRQIFYDCESGRIKVENTSHLKLETMKKAIKVLVVDDSETIRRLLGRILTDAPGIEVVATTGDPSDAERLIRQFSPDLLTVDLHMPGMNGVELIEQILPRYKLPIVVISSLGMNEGPMVLSALEAGAVDYIQKPTATSLSTVAPQIIERVRTAASAKVMRFERSVSKRILSMNPSLIEDRLIAIGSSTGGTEALREVLTRLPEHIPPIVIVQHIPPVFSAALAKRLNELCPFQVKEAENNDALAPDLVLIAPGGKNMKVVRSGGVLRVRIEDSAPRNLHKPSVDILFESVAEVVAKKAIGAILTGMGADGAQGLLQLRKAGAHTIAQDESSCVVFGMPRKAIELGAAVETLELNKIAEAFIKQLRSR